MQRGEENRKEEWEEGSGRGKGKMEKTKGVGKERKGERKCWKRK